MLAPPSLIASFLPHARCLVPKNLGSICFLDGKHHCNGEPSHDEHHPVRPAPSCVLKHKSANNGAHYRAVERAQTIQRHSHG